MASGSSRLSTPTNRIKRKKTALFRKDSRLLPTTIAMSSVKKSRGASQCTCLEQGQHGKLSMYESASSKKTDSNRPPRATNQPGWTTAPTAKRKSPSSRQLYHSKHLNLYFQPTFYLRTIMTTYPSLHLTPQHAFISSPKNTSQKILPDDLVRIQDSARIDHSTDILPIPSIKYVKRTQNKKPCYRQPPCQAPIP